MIFLLFLTFLLYLLLLKAGFVYDDFWTIVHNPAVRAFSVGAFFRDAQTVAMPGSGMALDIYRPLATLSFSIDHSLWGMTPAAFHLTSLMIHLANGVLFWGLARKLLGKDRPALMATAIFLVHPCQVETVAWVTQRSTLLCAFGFLAALAACVRQGAWTWKRWVVLGLGWAISVFSKETGVMLPAVVGLLDFQGKGLGFGPRKKTVYGVLIAATAVFWIWRCQVVGQLSSAATLQPGWGSQWPLGVMAFPLYLGKMIIPWGLRVSYDHPAWSPWSLLGSGAIVLMFLALLTFTLQRRGIPAVALGWVLLTLIPVLHVIPIVPFVAERFLYLPLMGFSLGMAWLAGRWPVIRLPVYLWIAGCLAVSACYIPAWHSEKELWVHAVKEEPTNAFAHACLAQTLGDTREAELEYFKALVNRPTPGIRSAAYQNLASLHHEWGHSWKARYWKTLAQTGLAS